LRRCSLFSADPTRIKKSAERDYFPGLKAGMEIGWSGKNPLPQERKF